MKESFLELWNSNDETIKNLTKNDIIKKLNATKFSPETGHQMDFSSLLGDIERDNSGMIISGRSILMSFNLFINFTEVESQDTGNSAGTEDWATVNTMLLEAKFLEVMERLKRDLENDKMKIYYTAGRSFGDISSTTMFKDIDKLFIGVTLMIIYMVFVLSKYGWTEIRFLLTMFGMMSCAMAFISGCGISSFFLFYSPVHTSLPFLLMGLGVDDIFVIMSAFRRVPNDRPLPERIATCLQHAGASITVTSLTDILAFLVGGTTILPSLQSFCLFASICIFMTYIFVATFFVAILTLDERRLQQNRNGCIPCIKHKGQTDLWCEPNLMLRSIRSIYSNVILTKPGKIFVIISAFVISIFCLRHVFMLTQKFDSTWFIPSSSYYFEYVMKYRFYYPDRGYEAQVIMGNLNYTQEMTKILLLSEQIKNETNVLDNVQSWIIPFRDFVNINFNLDIRDVQMTDSQFKYYLSKFLYSATGGRYQANVRFKEKLVCGQATSDIKISSITFRFHKFSDRDEYLPAKKTIERLIKEANFTSNHETFLWAKIFANWITDEIIDEEIFRNIALALFGVFICTAIMIVNLQVCLYIFTCVLLTMVRHINNYYLLPKSINFVLQISIGGLMQVWGLTLDLVTCISLQLAVGLCVGKNLEINNNKSFGFSYSFTCLDYAAHIGHTFLTISEGDGNQRALKTVENIGAAVLQGGFSTLLAVTLLSFSDAYTYQTFFKIFTIVVFFGLYYGIVFLPVILSIVPPKPYDYKMHKTIRLQKIDINNDTPLELLNKSNIEDTNFDVKVNDENCDENGKINLNY